MLEITFEWWVKLLPTFGLLVAVLLVSAVLTLFNSRTIDWLFFWIVEFPAALIATPFLLLSGVLFFGYILTAMWYTFLIFIGILF